MLETYLTTPAAIWTVFLVTAALTGAATDAAGRAILRFRDAGRSWIITLPETPGALARIERRRVNRGTVTRKAPGGDESETVIVSGDASYSTKRSRGVAGGPLHFLSQYGANLVAPRQADELASLPYPTRRGDLHLVTRDGATLVAPTKDEAAAYGGEGPLKDEDPVAFRRFRIWDPLIYWRATRENDMEDLYAAQRERDHWAVKLAPVAIILFIVLMGSLAFMLWKIVPLLQKAGGN